MAIDPYVRVRAFNFIRRTIFHSKRHARIFLRPATFQELRRGDSAGTRAIGRDVRTADVQARLEVKVGSISIIGSSAYSRIHDDEELYVAPDELLLPFIE
jgi:hypothetical protein